MTKEQKKATCTLWDSKYYKYLQLIAGAGSGKTTTLLKSVSYCAEHYTNPKNICLITFSKKAANEMQERLANQTQVGFIGTMHSLGYSFLRQKQQQPIQLITEPEKIYKQIIANKIQQMDHIPLEFFFHGTFEHDPRSILLKREYIEYKIANKMYDFDDLIIEATKVLSAEQAVNPYHTIFVDEFQDTSPKQLAFIQSLVAKKIFVVGDDWQSIYKFRGADVSITMNFKHHFPETIRLFLTKNFRSQKKIVKLGNKVIKTLSSNFVNKRLTAFNKAEQTPILHLCRTSNILDNLEKVLLWNIKKNIQEQPVILTRTNLTKNFLLKKYQSKLDVYTIHSVKGLEFSNVIIFGMTPDLIPHKWGNLDEEARLLYVAITRAKKNLQFVGWERNHKSSIFLPVLIKQCKLNYLD